ncbi:hypothetical protein EVAR_74715_1 [Eumeta japonica]|uniref:Ada2b tri-helical domain-containing protein n=1 Tax=Eumeta variegata TaxID=151549 RepID=A0A4C1SRE4_EUMVA|nr:hypothetical protein EVAR_74715_1 [Eumeta japonica]
MLLADSLVVDCKVDLVLCLISYNDGIRQGSSGCLDSIQTKDQTQNSTPLPKKRDGESGLSSTSPRCTRDGSTACGCSKKHSCSNASSRHLLTNNEIQLCGALSLQPAQYVTLKGVLLRRPPAPDNEVDLTIRHYLHTSGWIRN